MNFTTATPSTLDHEGFMALFGPVFENAPWVAQRSWELGIDVDHDDVDGMHARMAQVINAAPPAQQRELVDGHPRLGAKVPVGDAYEESRGEQARAGLAGLDAAGRQRFHELNAAYESRFGFPFILAVAGLEPATILSTFERRLAHDDHAAEFAEALAQVIRIGRLRLERL